MRFVFLGTGTSAGVPTIGCACRVCTSADPRDTRLRTGAAVQWVDPGGHPRTVLIDAGPDLRQQALRHGLRRCDAVLFTHNHVDHTFGVDELRRFNAVQHAPIDIYAEDHTLEHLRAVYRHIFEAHRNVNDSFVATLIAHRVEPGVPIEIHGLRFTPVRLLHGRLPIVGYRIEPVAQRGPRTFGAPDAILPLAYCTDVSAIPPETWSALRGLRTLVLDALRPRKHPTHFSIDEAVCAAENIGAGQTWFIHMAHEVMHAEVDASLPVGMRLAWDGLVLGDVEESAVSRGPAAEAVPDPE